MKKKESNKNFSKFDFIFFSFLQKTQEHARENQHFVCEKRRSAVAISSDQRNGF